MPGGGRPFTYVWVDGKAPRYWTVMAIALCVFVLCWFSIIGNLPRFATTKPDSIHSLSIMKGSFIQYYPPVVVWIAEYGLFMVMGWIFVLALIMAFKRTVVWKR